MYTLFMRSTRTRINRQNQRQPYRFWLIYCRLVNCTAATVYQQIYNFYDLCSLYTFINNYGTLDYR